MKFSSLFEAKYIYEKKKKSLNEYKFLGRLNGVKRYMYALLYRPTLFKMY